MTYSTGEPLGSRPRDEAGDAQDTQDVGLLSPVSAGTASERLTGDRALVDAMVRVEAALLHALADTQLAPADVRADAARMDAAAIDPRRLALDAAEGGNPVIPLVTLLRDQVGARHRCWVHIGATSQDVLDSALMLVSSSVARQVEADLLRLAGSLAALADQTRSVPMVARTLTQQAMPTTLGMRVSGWLAGVHDAVRMIRACTSLPVSLGGPVGTAAAYGTAAAEVAEAFAAHLGQRAPVSPWHTRRTPVVGLGTALTIAGEGCGKIAADVLVMSQSEVGEAREGTRGTSSSMAHKANPAQSILVASAARQLPALLSVLATSAAAEQERPAGAWHAEWQTLRTMLRLAGGAVERTADLVAALELDHEAMQRNLDRLVAAVGEDESWVGTQTEHVGVWIDRVLAQHEEVCG